ncbi:hypothetical protein PDJAM_G00236920 [Pangasius djambal]|uniref:Uncharacterized protein n=1 Tax=Pangasius djambal TaxID=1691987 RepID=A0ACC5YFT7_9TELE|nr:hypothetical protein [Pangasius djambal]
MNAAKYREILEENLLQSAHDLRLGRRFACHHGDDPKRRDRSLNVYERPSPRPDMNPTEHLWRELKMAVHRRYTCDRIELERVCAEEREKSRSEKIYKLYERKLHGDFDTNSHIQKKKEFRNPSIYEKLIQFCGIDELGTNYPKDMFDPHGWSEDSYYESLAKAQKIEMEKLEKAKKERTKIEFVTGTKKGTSTNAAAVTTNTTTTTSTDAQKRKSKWDSAVPVTLSQPALLTTTATLPGVVSVTTTASGTKTTVISAVGTILKKAKQ